MNKVAIIIPARFGSKRLHGKPLLKLGNKTIIQHVYENAASSRFANRVIVATDDSRIYDTVKGFGGDCTMTPINIKSGTDRIAHIAKSMDSELIMNLQGDEPFLTPSIFDIGLKIAIANQGMGVVTLATKIRTLNELNNPNNVKVVMDKDGNALYFSRFPIPFARDDKGKLVKTMKGHYRHIGIYIFRRKTLLEFVKLKQSALEKLERLEQLRLLENGYQIRVAVTGYAPAGIDTPEDLRRARVFFERKRKVL